tara:strand:- start:241 stop:930 length:690 start_codon:yes stop_codon:yes gene_type:complete
MELTDKLKTIFADAEIVKIQDNETHSFSINWIKSTKNRPYHLIFTSGLSNKEQTVSEKCVEYKHIELYFCLPDYWKVSEKSPEHSWPIHWLNRIAEVPQKSNSWFGPGDTLPAGNPSKNISSMMEENHFILAEPMKIQKLTELELNDKKIRFLSIIPIYQKELDYKLRNSAKVLIAKYQHKNYNELIDNYRESVVGKMSFKYLWLVVIATIVLAAVAVVLFTDGEWRSF